MSSWRQYVLNDASIVAKARFYILSNTMNTLTKMYTVKKVVPVQINPSNISGTYLFSKPYSLKGVTDPEDGTVSDVIDLFSSEGDGDSTPTNSIDIVFPYNIYDEYNVKTMDGMLGAVSKLSLEDEDSTSLWFLKNSAPCVTVFVWGDIQIFGVLSGVKYTYDSFSRWGNPLSAEVTATIIEYPINDTSDKRIKPLESRSLSLVYAQAEATTATETAINTAALLASAAMR